MKLRNLLALIFIFVIVAGTYAQSRVNVKFARGMSSATMRGAVSGYRYVDYRVGARGGQTISVKIVTRSPYASFVIFDGRMQNIEGAAEQTDWSGTLPSDGTYIIRVLLPRSEARRKGSMANYSLHITIN